MSNERELCPKCGQPAWSKDQWNREWCCSNHGGEYRFLAPWYQERRDAWAEAARRELDIIEAEEAKTGVIQRERRRAVVDGSMPWNIAADHDSRQDPAYQATLESYCAAPRGPAATPETKEE